MKVILVTITLIDLLAIGIIGTNISSLENAFAQTNRENPPLMEDDKNSIEIMPMSINPSLWSTGLEQFM
jgi:hypothetical protein